jgi:tetratricopeptide (TPR) repeat protein
MRNRNLLPYRERELQELIERYEKSKEEGTSIYFDSDDVASMADVYATHQHPEEGMELVEYGLRLHPDSLELLTMQAYIYSDLGRTDKAVEIAETLPEDSEDVDEYTEIMLLKSYLAFTTEQDTKALNIIKKVLRLDLDVHMFCYLIYQMMDFGHAQLAHTIIQTHEEKYKNFDIFKTLLSEYYAQEGDYDKAIQYLNEVLDKDPYSTYNWYLLAHCYLDTDQFDKAIDACNYALVVDDEVGDLYMIKATCYAYLGNIDESVKNCALAEKYNPKLKVYYQYMAAACVSDEQWDTAYDFIRKVDIYHLEPIEVMKKEGTVEYQRKMIYNLLVTLGCAYYNMPGRKMRGEECWKMAKKMAPEQPGLLIARGRLLYENGQPDKGYRLWQKAEKMSSTIEHWDALGTNSLEVVRLGMAIRTLMKVHEQNPHYEGINEKLAMAHLLKGDFTQFNVYNEQAIHPITGTDLDGMTDILKSREPRKIVEMINRYLDRVYEDLDLEADDLDDEEDFEDFEDFDDLDGLDGLEDFDDKPIF